MSVARRREIPAAAPGSQGFQRREPATPRYLALAAILVLYGGLAWGYALATPPWNNPDEPAHFNYVAHIATTGTLPVLQPGDWDAAALERLKSTRFAGGESVAAIRYESWQPPLYYLLAAPVYALVRDQPPLTQVRALRLLGVLLGGATLVMAYLAARDVLGRSRVGHIWSALAVPLVMSGVPMFTAVSGAVTNDVLANLVGAMLTLALLRLLASDRPAYPAAAGSGAGGQPRDRAWPSRWVALALGALLGLGLLTKLTLAVFVPLALLVVAYRAMMPPRVGTSAGRNWALPWLGWLMVGLMLLWLPWLIRQGLTYGWDDLLASRRHDAVVVGQARFPGLSADYAWRWATTTYHSFWAQFGWMGIPVADRYYWGWGALTLLAGGGLAAGAARAWRAERQATGTDRASLLHAWLLLVLVPLGVLAELLYYNLSFEQAQGRYLFPALGPLAILAVAGWSSLAPRRWRKAVPLLLGIVLVLVNAFVLLRVLTPAFAA